MSIEGLAKIWRMFVLNAIHSMEIQARKNITLYPYLPYSLGLAP